MLTHRRQKIGQVLFLGAWAPLLIIFLTMTGLMADETGKLPGWLAGGVTAMFNLMWISYDSVYSKIFGDGERTEAERDATGSPDEEKTSLLANGHGR